MMRSDHDYDNNFDDDTKSRNNSNSKVLVGWNNNQSDLVQ